MVVKRLVAVQVWQLQLYKKETLENVSDDLGKRLDYCIDVNDDTFQQ